MPGSGEPKYRRWDAKKDIPEKLRFANKKLEKYDVLGAKIPLILPLMLVCLNAELSSNQTIKKNSHKIISGLLNVDNKLIPIKIFYSLFWYSLPDIRTEFDYLRAKKKTELLPSAFLTMIFHVFLLIFHLIMQSIQLLLQGLSLPSLLTGIIYKKALKKLNELEYLDLYIFLGIVSAILNTPFQAACIVSNNLGYFRSIVDAALILLKMILQLVSNAFMFLCFESPNSEASVENESNLIDIDRDIAPNWTELWKLTTCLLINMLKLLPFIATFVMGNLSGLFSVMEETLVTLPTSSIVLLDLICLFLELVACVWTVQSLALIGIGIDHLLKKHCSELVYSEKYDERVLVPAPEKAPSPPPFSNGMAPLRFSCNQSNQHQDLEMKTEAVAELKEAEEVEREDTRSLTATYL